MGCVGMEEGSVEDGEFVTGRLQDEITNIISDKTINSFFTSASVTLLPMDFDIRKSEQHRGYLSNYSRLLCTYVRRCTRSRKP